MRAGGRQCVWCSRLLWSKFNIIKISCGEVVQEVLWIITPEAQTWLGAEELHGMWVLMIINFYLSRPIIDLATKNPYA